VVRIDPYEGPQPGPFRPDELARVLNRHRVEYVVIGGIAAIRHGSRRTTLDLDIVPEPTPANLRRLAAVLEQIDAHVRGVDAHLLGIDPRDPETLRGGADLGLATDLGVLDVLQEVIGVDYAQLRARAEPARLGAEEILVAHVDDLIAMKLRAGRPIDLQDVAAITGHEVRDE
jgi:uncharacterized nucleotidyltransferase DUF6036